MMSNSLEKQMMVISWGNSRLKEPLEMQMRKILADLDCRDDQSILCSLDKHDKLKNWMEILSIFSDMLI